MKKWDTSVTLILTIICNLVPENPYTLTVLTAVLILLGGYSLKSAVYPSKHGKENLLPFLVTALFMVLLTLIFWSFVGKTYVIPLLSAVIIICLPAVLLRRKHERKVLGEKKQGYMICKKCSGYYKLKLGEYPEDFEKCQCGGELHYKTEKLKPKTNETHEKTESKRTGLKSVKTELPETVIPTNIKGAAQKKAPNPKIQNNSHWTIKLNIDLLLMLLTTVLTVAFIFVPPLNTSPVRVILGFILIFFVPGYVLVSYLFPQKNDLSGTERFLLSFGVSMAITTLSGFLLNYTPFKIHLESMVSSLTLIIVFLTALTYLKRQKIEEKDVFTVEFRSFRNIKNLFTKGKQVDRILSMVLVFVIVLAISMTGYALLQPKQDESFTEFYVLGSNGTMGNYPTNSQTGNLTVGIVNHEHMKVDYKLVVTSDGVKMTETYITLLESQKIEIPYSFKVNNSGKMDFQLYKLPDNTDVYRSLHIWT